MINIPENELLTDILNGLSTKELEIKYSCSKNTIYRKKLEMGINNLYTQNNIKPIECSICGRKISRCNYETHYNSCLKKKNEKDKPKLINILKKRRIAWNKGLTKETNKIIFDQAVKYSITQKGRIVSEEAKIKLRKALKESIKTGGYRKGSGRGKSGWYKGYWCDSTYELAFVIYNIDHNIKFKRNTEKFPYEYNNETHNYIPDFILPDGSYIEIKGFNTEKDIFKHKSFPYKLKVLMKNDLQYAFNYVKDRYKIKKFELLYDDCSISLKEELKIQEKIKRDIDKKLELENTIKLVLNSNIDFSKYGWVSKVSNVINKTPQNVVKWMKRNMFDFWSKNCLVNLAH